MKTRIISTNFRPLLRAFFPFLVGIAALWAMPRNAHGQLYVTQFLSSGDVVSEYNATTGKVISAKFITGLNGPIGLAVTGRTAFFLPPTLFVANNGSGTVGAYNATTGVAISPSFITGLSAPAGLALKGNTLFLADDFGFVGAYDANTGAVIPSFMTITGLNLPLGIAVKSAK